MRELSLNVMDIVQNSLSAGAGQIQISVVEDQGKDRLTIVIADNGRGMTAEQVSHVIDPFYTTRTTRKVGLGVPLFKMEAEMTGGSFEIESDLFHTIHSRGGNHGNGAVCTFQRGYDTVGGYQRDHRVADQMQP